MKIAVSCGDVNGIGLECFFKALDNFYSEYITPNNCQLLLVVESKTLKDYVDKVQIPIKIFTDYAVYYDIEVGLINCETYAKPEFGIVTKQAGKLAQESVLKAIDYVQQGKADALLTLPISKEAVYLAGWRFPGHTELIASYYNDTNPLMILFAGKLRVALVSIHSAYGMFQI